MRIWKRIIHELMQIKATYLDNLARLSALLTEVTHTGQVWAENDYRNVRFTNAKRWVNKNWGMKYGHQQETIVTSKRIVVCDGDGPLGHPISYICLDKPGKHYCHYCLKSFVREQKKK